MAGTKIRFVAQAEIAVVGLNELLRGFTGEHRTTEPSVGQFYGSVNAGTGANNILCR